MRSASDLGAGRRFSRRDLGPAALAVWLRAGSGRGVAHGAAGSTGSAEILRWRSDFPALDQTVNGRPLTYLDSAATTQRPTTVLAALQNYYQHDNANPGSTLHTLARRAHERYESARRTVSDFIHAADPDEGASCYLYTQTSDLDRLATALRELTGMENSR